jgi:hypothetical protein
VDHLDGADLSIHEFFSLVGCGMLEKLLVAAKLFLKEQKRVAPSGVCFAYRRLWRGASGAVRRNKKTSESGGLTEKLVFLTD